MAFDHRVATSSFCVKEQTDLQSFREGNVPARRRLIGVSVTALLILAIGWGCTFGDDGIFSVRELVVVPNPAEQGDIVTFVFDLVVVPKQDYTITGLIDGTVAVTQTRQVINNGPFELVVGSAEDLIAEFGLGTHVADVEVRLHKTNDVFGARSVNFELREPEQPPAGIAPEKRPPTPDP